MKETDFSINVLLDEGIILKVIHVAKNRVQWQGVCKLQEM
jgi:hypothetical protein